MIKDNIYVRLLNIKDVTQVEELEKIAYANESHHGFTTSINLKDNDFPDYDTDFAWGLFENNNLIGLCRLFNALPTRHFSYCEGYNPDALVLESVFVSHEYDGAEYAKYLIKEAIRQKSIHLNQPVYMYYDEKYDKYSQDFFESLGFKEIENGLIAKLGSRAQKKDHIYTGFYNDLFNFQKDYGDQDFAFLENEFGELPTTDVHAGLMLHGYCYLFAQELSKKFGYEIEEITDENGGLIHTYCVGDINGRTAFIDVRGITTDIDLFFDEFRDWIWVKNGQIQDEDIAFTYFSSYKEYINDFPSTPEALFAAESLVNTYSDYYNTDIFVNRQKPLIRKIEEIEQRMSNSGQKNNKPLYEKEVYTH